MASLSLLTKVSSARHFPKLSLATDLIRRQYARGAIKSSEDLSQKYVSSLQDIPTSNSRLPPFLELMLDGGPAYLHEHCDRLHKQLGPIFRHKLGPRDLIFLADTSFIQTVIANEGSYPQNAIPDCWTYFNEINNIERGMFFLQGESWARLRKNFNKVLLAADLTHFTKHLLTLNDDLFRSWSSVQDDGNLVIDDAKANFNRWSIESTGLMLFGKRIGCIQNSSNNDPDRSAEELVRQVANMFMETTKLQFLPVHLAHKLKFSSWKRFEQASSSMLKLASDITRKQISLMRSSRLNNGLVAGLLDEMSDEDITKSVVDLIIAAADTTSNSLQWMLFSLARYQQVQTKIRAELDSLSGFEDFMSRASYLKSFIKEVSRLYPTAPFISRKLNKEVVLDSYSIPAGGTFIFSLYTTSRMDKYFEDPLAFRPERWIRKTRETNIERVPRHAYASLPFGLGARMCIGKKAAELELGLLIASIVRNYDCSLLSCNNPVVKLKMVTCPKEPIRILLQPRSNQKC